MEFVKNVSQFIPFSICVIVSVTFAAIVFYFIFKLKVVRGYAKVIGIIVLPGIVLHECSHLLFCKIAGIDVTEVSLFHLEKHGVGGYVKYTPHGSFIAAFFAGLGPIFINGFLISLLIYCFKDINEGLLYYLIFALTVGACPSYADVKNIFDPFHRDGNRAFIELLILFIPIIPALFIGGINVSFMWEFNWVTALITYCGTLFILIASYYLVKARETD